MTMETRKGCVAWRPRSGKCVSQMLFHESDQNLPLEPANHDPLDHLGVVIGVFIALRDLVHPFSPKVASLDLEGGWGKIEDLMVLLRNLPQMSKNALYSNKLAQVAPQTVFVYHLQASR